MSKHIGRNQRWAQVDAKTYASNLGKVLYQQGAWYAVFDYKTLQPPKPERPTPSWLQHEGRLGPFKRPRNAMVALEREVTFLKNRHGQDILIGDQLWAET